MKFVLIDPLADGDYNLPFGSGSHGGYDRLKKALAVFLIGTFASQRANCREMIRCLATSCRQSYRTLHQQHDLRLECNPLVELPG